MKEGPGRDLSEIYPRLDNIPKEDWEGIVRRAEKEGVSVDELKLREDKDLFSEGGEIDARDDIPGLLERACRERKLVQEITLRKNDDIHRIYQSMYALLATAGFPISGHFEGEEGPVTKRFHNPLSDVKIIAEIPLGGRTSGEGVDENEEE